MRDYDVVKSSNARYVTAQLGGREREFFDGNLLVRIYLIIGMILVDRPCARAGLIPPSR